MVSLAIACVHLFSGNNSSQRIKQLQFLEEKLNATSSDGKIILGDFNYEVGEEDSIFKENGYQDIWAALYPSVHGGTRGGRRIDHIMITKSSPWNPTKINIIGDEPVKGSKTIFISDHFGLVSTLHRT